MSHQPAIITMNVMWSTWRIPIIIGLRPWLRLFQVHRCSPPCVCWSPSDYRAVWMTYYTHHRLTDALHCVCVDVLQITLQCEWIITLITGQQMLSTVCVLMCLQITLMCEGLITHITHKQMFSTVCVDVPSDYPAVWTTYYTHHRSTDALHCVCVDVPSDYCAVWMTYYTHWSYILASHQNNYSAPQMLYQIHDLNMDDPHHLWVPVLAK